MASNFGSMLRVAPSSKLEDACRMYEKLSVRVGIFLGGWRWTFRLEQLFPRLFFDVDRQYRRMMDLHRRMTRAVDRQTRILDCYRTQLWGYMDDELRLRLLMLD